MIDIKDAYYDLIKRTEIEEAEFIRYGIDLRSINPQMGLMWMEILKLKQEIKNLELEIENE